ncbi:MAG: NUDIX hydrolase, partial [Pseudomonadota bacterium]
MTLRAAIHAEIAGIAPFDAQETAVRDAALAWVASGVELCRLARPATPPRHLVCYFLATDGDHVLLVDHILAGLWL